MLWIAQKFSSNKALKIKHLHVYDESVTAVSRFQGAPLLAVEFSARAGIGFARD